MKGFLSGLMKIASPFTGGITGMLSDLGSTSAGAAKGAAEGRQIEGQNINNANQNANQQFGLAQNAQMNAGQLDLDRQKFSQDAAGTNAKRAFLASMLGGGFKPTSINTPGIQGSTVGGGLAASLGSDGAKQSMAELMKQSLHNQMTPETFTGGQIIAPPTMHALPQAGHMENILGGVGVGSSLLASVLQNIKKTGGE